MREIRSAPPPGANGTMMRTGRACAGAGRGSREAARAPAKTRGVALTVMLCSVSRSSFRGLRLCPRRDLVDEAQRMLRAQIGLDRRDVEAVARQHQHARIREFPRVALDRLDRLQPALLR